MTTPTDWRALCAELVDIATAHCNPDDDAVGYCAAVLSRARTALAQPEPNSSSLSDGYHTFAELYEHRHALCLALMRAMPQHWWFSWRHADGERCFGGDDWFIAGAKLPSGSSVTYHLPADLYSIAQATGATELKKGRRWDGHTPIDVVSRLREWAALAQPEPQGPSFAEIIKLARGFFDFRGISIGDCFFATDISAKTDPGHALEEFVRALLNRWGRPAIQPVPVSERLPGAEDCDTEGCCWTTNYIPAQVYSPVWKKTELPQKSLKQDFSNAYFWRSVTYWLPYWALPVPQQTP